MPERGGKLAVFDGRERFINNGIAVPLHRWMNEIEGAADAAA
jgi:hypothetical protein